MFENLFQFFKPEHNYNVSSLKIVSKNYLEYLLPTEKKK